MTHNFSFSTSGDYHNLAQALGLEPGRSSRTWVPIRCPECGGGRKRANDTSTAFNSATGGWFCFHCDSSGHLDEFVDDPNDVRPRPGSWSDQTRRDPSQTRSKPAFDVGAAWRALQHHHRVRGVGLVQQWGREVRRWPEALVQELGRLDDMAWALDNLSDDYICGDLVQLSSSRIRLDDGTWRQGAKRRLFLALRNAQGEVVSVKRRWVEPDSPPEHDPAKSKALPRSITGQAEGELLTFGSIPAAIQAMGRGEPLYICEGGPDWLALRAFLKAENKPAAVLGASSASELPRLAAEVVAQLKERGLERDACDVRLFPHQGDTAWIGHRKAIEAARLLDPYATVRVGRPRYNDDRDKADVADVARFGELNGLTEMIGGAAPLTLKADVETIHEDLEGLRRQTGKTLQEAILRDGADVILTETGGGKTFGGLKALAATREQRGSEVQDRWRSPTRSVRDEAVRRAKYRFQIDAAVDRGRSAQSCRKFDEWTLHARVDAEAASDYCHRCPHNVHGPGRDPDEEGCPYIQQVGLHRDAQTVHQTHARGVLAPGSALDEKVMVRWKALFNLMRSASPVRVVRRQTLKGWVIEATEDPSGQVLSFNPAEWDEEQRSPLGSAEARLRLMLGAMAEVEYLYDVQVDDERDQARWVDVSLDLDELGVLIRRKDLRLGDEARRGLEQALEDSEMEACGGRGSKRRRRRRRKLSVSAGVLRRVCPPDQIEVLGEEYRAGAWALGKAGEARLKALERVPPFVAKLALRQVAERGWGGSYVYGGRLHLRLMRPQRRQARSVVALDATTTPALARLEYGPGVRTHRHRLGKPEGFRVIQVPYGSAGSKAELVARDGSGRPTLAMQLLEALRVRYDSPETAWAVFKDWVTDKTHPAHPWVMSLEGKVFYHGGAQSRGSNEFEGCERLVVLPWHVPKLAIEAEAHNLEALAIATRDAGLDGVDWVDEAARSLVTASMVQVVGRMRWKGEVVLVDKRSPTDFHPAYEPDQVVDPSVLISVFGGRLWGAGARAWWTRRATQAAIQAGDLGWSPEQGYPSQFKEFIEGVMGVTDASIRVPSCIRDAHDPPPSLSLKGRGGWRALAAEADLCATGVRCEHGGERVVFSLEPLTEREAREVAGLAPDQLEELESVARRLMEGGQEVTRARLAEGLERSESTVKRRLRRFGLTVMMLVERVRPDGAEVSGVEPVEVDCGDVEGVEPGELRGDVVEEVWESLWKAAEGLRGDVPGLEPPEALVGQWLEVLEVAARERGVVRGAEELVVGELRWSAGWLLREFEEEAEAHALEAVALLEAWRRLRCAWAVDGVES